MTPSLDPTIETEIPATEPFPSLIPLVPAIGDAIHNAGRAMYGDVGYEQVLARAAAKVEAETRADQRLTRRHELREQIYTAQQIALAAVIIVLGALAATILARISWLMWTL